MSKFRDIRFPGMASFYCLLFGLMIFIIDEVIIYFPKTIDYAISFILLVTLLSYTLWIMLWLRFRIDFKIPRLNAKRQRNFKLQSIRRKITSYIRSIFKKPQKKKAPKRNFKFWVLLLIYLGYFAIILLGSRLITGQQWQYTVIYVTGMALPVLIFGIIMSFCTKDEILPTYENMGIHLCEFSMLAICSLALIYGSVAIGYLPETILIPWDQGDLILLKFAVDIFLLVNGLIFAYAIPVWLMGRVPKYIRSVATNRIKGPAKERHQLEKRLFRLIEEIEPEDLE